MSLNGPREDLETFDSRQMKQVYIQEHRALVPNEIKNTSMGLRAFVFYRNRLAFRQKPVKKLKPILVSLG